MKLPKTLSGWCMILFFLIFGIASFWSFSHSSTVLGVLALGVAALSFIGK